MKELCSCNCCGSPHAGYRTPWCSLLNGHDDSCAVLHLWYQMDVLRQEARKRLAYLGASNGYQNVPDVNDLAGVEPSGTPTPLHLVYSQETIKARAKAMLAYLGAANGHLNIPNIDDLVGTYNSTTGTQLLLSYSVTALKEEIEKKTAYLGKFRRTDDSVQLLDLIAMTDDENELFVSFAKEAMTDVWNILSAPFVGVSKSAWWQETTTASYASGVQYLFDVRYSSSHDIEPLKQAVLGALVERIIYKWLLYAYPDEAKQYDANYQQAIAEVQVRCNDFKARAAAVFTPIAKEAMLDVWNALSAPFVGVTKRAWWQDSATETYQAGVHYLFDVSYVLTATDTDALQNTVLEAIVSRIVYKWLMLSYPDEAAKFDADFQKALADIAICVNAFKARWSGLFVPFAKAAMADVFKELGKYMPRHEKTYWFREGKETAVFTDDPLPDPAVTFYAGQYVEYNDDLYMAIEDGSSDDFAGKLVPTEDYRDSVHYGILWRCKSNINAVEPLDTAIFEALVARIVYKWVAKAYPAEAEPYLAEYNENVDHIRDFARMMEGPQIVNRVPRML